MLMNLALRSESALILPSSPMRTRRKRPPACWSFRADSTGKLADGLMSKRWMISKHHDERDSAGKFFQIDRRTSAGDSPFRFLSRKIWWSNGTRVSYWCTVFLSFFIIFILLSFMKAHYHAYAWQKRKNEKQPNKSREREREKDPERWERERVEDETVQETKYAHSFTYHLGQHRCHHRHRTDVHSPVCHPLDPSETTRAWRMRRSPSLPSNQVHRFPLHFLFVCRIATIAGSIPWRPDHWNYRRAVGGWVPRRVASIDEWILSLAFAVDVCHFAWVRDASWCKNSAPDWTNARTRRVSRTYCIPWETRARTKWREMLFHWTDWSVVHTKKKNEVNLVVSRSSGCSTCTVWTWTFWILRTANSHIVTRGKYIDSASSSPLRIFCINSTPYEAKLWPKKIFNKNNCPRELAMKSILVTKKSINK